jgi:hypothetical protein
MMKNIFLFKNFKWEQGKEAMAMKKLILGLAVLLLAFGIGSQILYAELANIAPDGYSHSEPPNGNS